MKYEGAEMRQYSTEAVEKYRFRGKQTRVSDRRTVDVDVDENYMLVEHHPDILAKLQQHPAATLWVFDSITRHLSGSAGLAVVLDEQIIAAKIIIRS